MCFVEKLFVTNITYKTVIYMTTQKGSGSRGAYISCYVAFWMLYDLSYDHLLYNLFYSKCYNRLKYFMYNILYNQKNVFYHLLCSSLGDED